MTSTVKVLVAAKDCRVPAFPGVAGHIVPFPPRQPPPPAGVLDLAARLTADVRDIRMGVDLVRAAATRAGKEGRSRVTRWDVLDVVAGVKSPVLAARTAALSSGERALLYQLAEQSLAGDTMMAGAIFEEAQEYIAVGRTTYHTRLRRLADAGVIDLLWTREGA